MSPGSGWDWRRLGPGLLWAGAAVGVSHLVQSTRAGADHGLSLIGVVIVAHLVRYPAFEAGHRYTAATGRSLLEAYRRQGWGALLLFGALTALTMCIVQAAVVVVTAGMASALITDRLSVTAWAGLLLAGAVGLSATGGFRALNVVMKAMIVALSLSTVAAVALVLPTVDWSTRWPPIGWDPATVGFVVAFAGWMPAPFDTAVWQSQWAVERGREAGGYDGAVARADFHIGYGGTAVLACLFVVLGAAVLHGSGAPVPSQAPAFARTFVDAYASVLGSWARPLVLVAAFATMLSTTLAVVDGFARALVGTIDRWRGPEEPGVGPSGRAMGAAMLGIGAGAWGIVALWTANLRDLVDFATTVSFVVTPALAWMNYRAVCGPDLPSAHRPGPWLVAWHRVGLAVMGAFSVGYVAHRLGAG